MSGVITFEQALARCDSGQKKYLLLGNGFSTALFGDIFSYKSLKDEADFSENPRLIETFNQLGTPDFEKVIRALEFSVIIGDIYGVPTEKTGKIRKEADDLKEILISTIADRHPENTTKVLDEAKTNCNNFLNHFGEIYTLNYDVLLYWVLLHGRQQRLDDIDDGFRLPDDNFGAEYRVFDSPHSPTFFFLHGGLHLFDSGSETRKYVWIDTGKTIISQVREAIGRNLYPLFVAEGSSDQKMTKINHSGYLSKALRSFETICGTKNGNLFIFGHSLNETDEHILSHIRKGKISRVFVSAFKSEDSDYDESYIQKVKHLSFQRPKHRPLEIVIYDAQSAKVWG